MEPLTATWFLFQASEMEPLTTPMVSISGFRDGAFDSHMVSISGFRDGAFDSPDVSENRILTLSSMVAVPHCMVLGEIVASLAVGL